MCTRDAFPIPFPRVSVVYSTVPGQVEDLVCPDSPDGGVINIRWQQPTTNPSSVNDYVVEVQEITHSPPGSRRLGLRTLTPPFQQEVRPNVTTSVSSGVGKWVEHGCLLKSLTFSPLILQRYLLLTMCQ